MISYIIYIILPFKYWQSYLIHRGTRPLRTFTNDPEAWRQNNLPFVVDKGNYRLQAIGGHQRKRKFNTVYDDNCRVEVDDELTLSAYAKYRAREDVDNGGCAQPREVYETEFADRHDVLTIKTHNRNGTPILVVPGRDRREKRTGNQSQTYYCS